MGEPRKYPTNIQGFDVVREPDNIFALYLMAADVGMRVRRLSGKPLAGEIAAFLRDAWAEGYGGGPPDTLVMDGAAVNYDLRIREFCLDEGVIIRGPQQFDPMQRKLEAELRKIGGLATP